MTPIAMALVVSACKDASDSEVVTAPIGPGGGVLVSADSILTIAIQPGALEETIDLSIQRSDEPPEVYGPAFRVQPNLELAIPATVTYRYELPEDTSETAIGYVDAEEFSDGQGRWRPLPVIQLEPTDKLIKASDPEISLFYGLLDSASDIPTFEPGTGVTTNSTETATPTTTTGPTTTNNPDGSDSGTSTGTTTDPDTSAGPTTDPPGTTDSGETGGSSSSSGEGSTTGVPFDCGNLPMGPLLVDEFMFDGTPLDGNSEDMTFSPFGIITRNGFELVTIDPAGTVAAVPTMVGLPETLGTRWTPGGTVVTVGRFSGELLEVQIDGTVNVLLNGLDFPNGVFVYQDGTIFFTEFNTNRAAWVNAAGGMLTELALGPAEAPNPNGIIYDPDRDLVFYSTYFAGDIYRVDVADLNNPGVPEVIANIPSLGGGDMVGLDGVVLDECGNLYIVDQNQDDAAGSLYRLELDAAGEPIGVPEVLVEAFPAGIANAVFAQGAGWGAYDTTLFTVGLPGRIFMVDVGVSGAPTPAG